MPGVFYAVNEGMGIAISSCQRASDWRLWRGIGGGRQPSRRSGYYWGQSANNGAWLTEEVAKIGEEISFGVGFIAWDLARRPELLDTALNLRPFWYRSFGPVNAYVGRVHERGVRLVTQVNSVEDGLRVAEAGVDGVTVQGSEAGGHTGWASMLPLLQGLVGQVRVPVIAAGGLDTAQGVAAA